MSNYLEITVSIVIILLAGAFLYLNTKKENRKRYQDEIKIHEKSAINGNRKSQFELAEVYYNLKNFDKAIYWYKESAKEGYDWAQYQLGKMFRYGYDRRYHKNKKNLKEAFYWLSLAANNGNYFAQYELGEMYFYGEGTLSDFHKAAYWIKKSNKETGQAKLWNENKLWQYINNDDFIENKD